MKAEKDDANKGKLEVQTTQLIVMSILITLAFLVSNNIPATVNILGYQFSTEVVKTIIQLIGIGVVAGLVFIAYSFVSTLTPQQKHYALKTFRKIYDVTIVLGISLLAVVMFIFGVNYLTALIETRAINLQAFIAMVILIIAYLIYNRQKYGETKNR